MARHAHRHSVHGETGAILRRISGRQAEEMGSSHDDTPERHGSDTSITFGEVLANAGVFGSPCSARLSRNGKLIEDNFAVITRRKLFYWDQFTEGDLLSKAVRVVPGGKAIGVRTIERTASLAAA